MDRQYTEEEMKKAVKAIHRRWAFFWARSTKSIDIANRKSIQNVIEDDEEDERV